MAADVAVACGLIIPITIVGFIVGVRFETGLLGVLVFILIGALWCLAFSGFGYAIALKTGNPAAVNSSFLLFFPFLFLTTSYVPREALSGWLDTVATWNPVTYLLAGMRSLISEGWEWEELGAALLAIAIVGAVSMTLVLRRAPRPHPPRLTRRKTLRVRQQDRIRSSLTVTTESVSGGSGGGGGRRRSRRTGGRCCSRGAPAAARAGSPRPRAARR